MVKNCDRGLENAARGRRPRAAFSSPNCFLFFFVNVYATLVIESTCAPFTYDLYGNPVSSAPYFFRANFIKVPAGGRT